MRLLFDHGVPSPLRRFLDGISVTSAREMGWEEYANGRLIAAAQEAGFEVVVTCDKNWAYQQNLMTRTIAVVVLPTNIWPHLEPHGMQIAEAIRQVASGTYTEVVLPRVSLVRRPPPEGR